jgi:hypothetical protein
MLSEPRDKLSLDPGNRSESTENAYAHLSEGWAPLQSNADEVVVSSSVSTPPVLTSVPAEKPSEETPPRPSERVSTDASSPVLDWRTNLPPDSALNLSLGKRPRRVYSDVPSELLSGAENKKAKVDAPPGPSSTAATTLPTPPASSTAVPSASSSGLRKSSSVKQKSPEIVTLDDSGDETENPPRGAGAGQRPEKASTTSTHPVGSGERDLLHPALSSTAAGKRKEATTDPSTSATSQSTGSSAISVTATTDPPVAGSSTSTDHIPRPIIVEWFNAVKALSDALDEYDRLPAGSRRRRQKASLEGPHSTVEGGDFLSPAASSFMVAPLAGFLPPAWPPIGEPQSTSKPIEAKRNPPRWFRFEDVKRPWDNLKPARAPHAPVKPQGFANRIPQMVTPGPVPRHSTPTTITTISRKASTSQTYQSHPTKAHAESYRTPLQISQDMIAMAVSAAAAKSATIAAAPPSPSSQTPSFSSSSSSLKQSTRAQSRPGPQPSRQNNVVPASGPPIFVSIRPSQAVVSRSQPAAAAATPAPAPPPRPPSSSSAQTLGKYDNLLSVWESIGEEGRKVLMDQLGLTYKSDVVSSDQARSVRFIPSEVYVW